MKSIKVSNVRVLGNSGNVILEFAGLLPSQIGYKPLSIITARLEPAQRAIISLTPQLLKGATLSVEDSDYNGIKTKGAIVPFKAGDKYVATEISSKVKSGDATVGEELTCEKDGLRIEGNINITLHPDVVAKISDRAIDIALTHQMANMTSVTNRTSQATANNNDNPLVDEPSVAETASGN